MASLDRSQHVFDGGFTHCFPNGHVGFLDALTERVLALRARVHDRAAKRTVGHANRTTARSRPTTRALRADRVPLRVAFDDLPRPCSAHDCYGLEVAADQRVTNAELPARLADVAKPPRRHGLCALRFDHLFC